MLQALRAAAMACHPGPTAGVTAAATMLAGAVGRAPLGVALTGAAVLTGQLSIGWSNDALDHRRDRAARRADKPVARGALSARAAWLLAVSSLAICLPLSLAVGLAAGAAHLTGVAAGWAYNAGAKSGWLSWLPYALAFGLLPAFVTLGLPGHPWPPAWLTTAAATLGVAAHLANAVPDLDDDLAMGIRGLPHRLGRRASLRLAMLLLAAAGATLAGFAPGLSSQGRAALAGVPVALALPVSRARPGTRLPFVLVLATALLDVTLLLVATRAHPWP